MRPVSEQFCDSMICFLEDTSLLKWFEDEQKPCGMAHQCNCFCTMGAGIAKTIRDAYPEVYTADKTTACGNKEKLGTFSVVAPTNFPNKRIYNIYGQWRYGREQRHTSYDALVTGLMAVREDAIKEGLTKLGIPYGMGCKLGGGSWPIVLAIIKNVFEDSMITCHICKYEP